MKSALFDPFEKMFIGFQTTDVKRNDPNGPDELLVKSRNVNLFGTTKSAADLWNVAFYHKSRATTLTLAALFVDIRRLVLRYRIYRLYQRLLYYLVIGRIDWLQITTVGAADFLFLSGIRQMATTRVTRQM